MYFCSFLLSVHGAPSGPGEDERTVAVNPDNGELLIAVMDGCGGAGGKRYPQADNWTGARLASHEAGRALFKWFLTRGDAPGSDTDARQQAEALRDVLRDTFQRLAKPLDTTSFFKTNMGATMPTTLSAVTARLLGPRLVRLRYFWAGNSRGYLFTADGLHQITRDDSVGALDPFEDLTKDGVLNNVICADQKFSIHTWETRVAEPCMILSASDGVFSYFLSPVELEGLLLRTMMQAKTPVEWEAALRAKIGAIAGDDHTLQLAAIGFQTYAAIQEAYSMRWKLWQERFGKRLEACKTLENPDSALAVLWADYKEDFMRRE